MTALIAITNLVRILNPENFIKKCPPQAVKNSDGKVAKPNKNIPNVAKIGLEIVAAIKKAPYSRPQGIRPKTRPRK